MSTAPTIIDPEPTGELPLPTSSASVHPRPEHHGLVVTGASRWPWYDDELRKAPAPIGAP